MRSVPAHLARARVDAYAVGFHKTGLRGNIILLYFKRCEPLKFRVRCLSLYSFSFRSFKLPVTFIKDLRDILSPRFSTAEHDKYDRAAFACRLLNETI